MKSALQESKVIDMPQQEEELEFRPVISGINVIFDFGHGSPIPRGKTFGNQSQSDLVDFYGRRMVEELEYDKVRMQFIDTRRPPGLSQEERLGLGPTGFVNLIASCGYFETLRKHNASTVEYCGGHLGDLAGRICEGLSDWGRCYVWGHRVSKPLLVDGETPFIRVKPFAINGPHADEYLKRLDPLGESLGRSIGQYMIDRGIGRIIRR